MRRRTTAISDFALLADLGLIVGGSRLLRYGMSNTRIENERGNPSGRHFRDDEFANVIACLSPEK